VFALDSESECVTGRWANPDIRAGERYRLAAVASLARGPNFLFGHANILFGHTARIWCPIAFMTNGSFRIRSRPRGGIDFSVLYRARP
jgi:hypothetical protein